MRPALACGTLLLLVVGSAAAAEVGKVAVTRDGDTFTAQARIRLDAPPHAVFEALQDYAQLPRFNPEVRVARVLGREPDGGVRVYVEVHACVLFFCKTVHEVQIMHADPSADGGTVTARILPGQGDFKHGRGRWVVRACADHAAPTCMRMRLQFTPDFWVPPVIGPWLIRLKMEDDATTTSQGLEKLARQLAKKNRV